MKEGLYDLGSRPYGTVRSEEEEQRLAIAYCEKFQLAENGTTENKMDAFSYCLVGVSADAVGPI